MPSNSIDAAFPSSCCTECYMFAKDQYVALCYDSGQTKNVISCAPGDITDGFPMLANTVFDKGIDCAFDTDAPNEPYIFAGNQCAKIIHTPRSEGKIISGPMSIAEMFPCLVGVHFEHGINAAIWYLPLSVILFKGDQSVVLNYSLKTHEGTEKIAHRYNCLFATVFENGFDAAFRTNNRNQFYIFKGDCYARIESTSFGHNDNFIVGGRIKRISDYWPALRALLEED